MLTAATKSSISSTGMNQTVDLAAHLPGLRHFGQRINEIGCNFAVWDGAGRLILLCEDTEFKSNTQKLKKAAVKLMTAEAGQPATRTDDGVLGRCLKADGCVAGALVVDMGRRKPARRQSAVDATSLAANSVNLPPEVIDWMLELFADKVEKDLKARREIEMVSTELAHVYEELVLLHKLGTNMKVTEPDSDFLQMACDSVTEIVNVEGIAIFLDKNIDGEERLVLAAGSGLIDADEYTTTVLRTRLIEQLNEGREALLDSAVDSPFRYRWPQSVQSILAVPLFGKEKSLTCTESARCFGQLPIIGQMVAINRLDRPDFDSTDTKLFNSVANGCAVFVENGRLFADLKDLFIGSLKALTSSIDAKDPYTRGHSERVAVVSRWIAERLVDRNELDSEQAHRIYLAGLLHDIGKVGVEEAVLRKQGKLTADEFEQIKKHPAIGAAILSGIKQMSDIVPGVLSHHERIDAKGYPNGLKGEQIPLIAKIIALADSFDAMTSKRTYRDALSVDDALAEIETALGSQFDERTGRVFLSSDVHRLWEMIQDGSILMSGANGFSQYGAEAVGVLVR